jgi:hypothetical protein
LLRRLLGAERRGREERGGDTHDDPRDPERARRTRFTLRRACAGVAAEVTSVRAVG